MIDLDHNATTPLHPSVRVALHELIDRVGVGQPSSIHGGGQSARAILEQARRSVGASLGAVPLEVTFTSGGTEALNLAIAGLHLVRREAARPASLAYAAFEHAATREPIAALERAGVPTYLLRTDAAGRLEPAAIDEVFERARARGDRIGVLCLMRAHHELGNIYNVALLVERARRHEPDLAVVCDAVAAWGKVPLSWRELGVDVLVVSAHKIHGPSGAGAVVHDAGLKLAPLVYGGGQERGRRGGTPGLLAVHGMGVAAAQVLPELLDARHATQARRDILADCLAADLGAVVLGDLESRLCNTLSVSVPRCDAELAVIALDLAGVRVSRGAACSSGAGQVSPTWAALGLEPQVAAGALRISLALAGAGDTTADLRLATQILVETLSRVRGEPPPAKPCYAKESP